MRRFEYIDYAKGIGMLCVIWGHIMYAGWSAKMVYAFHIPLFFFLSGMVFSKDRYEGTLAFLKRRFFSLLIPYMFFSFLTWGVWVLFLSLSRQPLDGCWKPLLETFLARGSEGYLVHNVPLWFVPCLFVVEMFYFFFRGCSGRIRILIALLFALVGCWLVCDNPFYDFTTLPWSLDVAFLAFPFYAGGNILVEKMGGLPLLMQKFSSHRGFYSCVMIGCFAFLYLGAGWNGRVTMGHASLGNSAPLFYFNAFCGIVATLLLCLWIQHVTSERGIFRWLRWWGENSFTVMAIHNPIKGVMVLLVARLLGVLPVDVNRSVLIARCYMRFSLLWPSFCSPLC